MKDVNAATPSLDLPPLYGRPGFAEVAGEQLDAVYRYLVYLTGDRSAAEDLTAETFEKAFAEAQGDDPLVPLDVDARLVAAVVGSWTGIPIGKMMKDEASLALVFRERLADRIKGQDQALDAVDRGMRAARSGHRR